MKHPMVRPAKPEFRQHLVRIADEVPVGKEQKLDEVPDRLRRSRTLGGRPAVAVRQGVKFMSAMLTYFGSFVTSKAHDRERIVRADLRRPARPATCSAIPRTCEHRRPRAIRDLSPTQNGATQRGEESVPEDEHGSALRPMPGVIWFDGKLVPTRRPRSMCSPTACTMPARCSRASALMAATIFKCTEHSERLHKSAEHPRFRDPLPWPRSTPPSGWWSKRTSNRTAYVRPIAWRGSEQIGVAAMHNTIHLAIAAWEWPSYFDPAQRLQGHPARPGRLSPARSGDRAVRSPRRRACT